MLFPVYNRIQSEVSPDNPAEHHVAFNHPLYHHTACNDQRLPPPGMEECTDEQSELQHTHHRTWHLVLGLLSFRINNAHCRNLQPPTFHLSVHSLLQIADYTSACGHSHTNSRKC